MAEAVSGSDVALFEEYPPCPLCGVPMGLVAAHKRWHVNQGTFDQLDWEAFLHEWVDE